MEIRFAWPDLILSNILLLLLFSLLDPGLYVIINFAELDWPAARYDGMVVLPK